MKNTKQFSLLAMALSALLLTGCGDAETTIIEREPVKPPKNDGGGGNNNNDIIINSLGRLAITSAESNAAAVVDIDSGNVLETFSLTHEGSALYASGGYRYAVVTARKFDKVEFIDGGLWREQHTGHLHDYKQAPKMSDYSLSGSRPTHYKSYDGKGAIFYDGDADAGTPASVQVVSDADIASSKADLVSLKYNINMHGVAQPRGELLFSTIRRDDAESTSSIKVLPDKVGIYHLHNNEYDLEQTLEATCPNLHGASQNHDFLAYGCDDGVLVAHKHGDKFEGHKIANIAAIDGMRIGSLYGHHDSPSFIGAARNRQTGKSVVLTVDPKAEKMEQIDWKPQEEATPVAYAFTHDGEHALILDNKGYLTILSVHKHEGVNHFEFEHRIDISEQDVTKMPKGQSFRMTVAQNGANVFVSDPIAKHVLRVDIESKSIKGDVELSFVPARITWLGIPKKEKH